LSRPQSTLRIYVRTLERALAEQADRPVVLSHRDWHLATEWHEKGVPLGLILETLDECKGKAIRSLSALASRVDEAWGVVLAGRRSIDPGDMYKDGIGAAEKLQAWRATLRKTRQGSALGMLLEELVQAMECGSVEPEVADRRLEDAIMSVAPKELLEEVRQAALSRLASHRARMTDDVFEQTLIRSVKERLRVELDLPRLD